MSKDSRNNTEEPRKDKKRGEKMTYLYLWLLLAVGLAVAIAISLMHDPSFFGLSLKQGTFRDVLMPVQDGGGQEEMVTATPGQQTFDSIGGDLIVRQDSALPAGLSPATPAGQEALTDASSGTSETNTQAGKPAVAAADSDSPASSGGASALQNQTTPATGHYSQSNGSVRSILIFGDSMTILVANRLAQYGAKNGYKVTSVTWDSSSSVTWSQCDTLDNYIRRANPDLIMIVLGSNELFLRDYNVRKPNIQQMLAKMGNIPYLWISPPNWKEDKGYNEFMTSVLAPGTFYNSNDLDLPRQKDHIHPTTKGGETWTDSIMKWVPKSAHPFPAQVPDEGTSNQHDLHYYKAKH